MFAFYGPLVVLLYGARTALRCGSLAAFWHCCAVPPIFESSDALETFLQKFLVACQSISSIEAQKHFVCSFCQLLIEHQFQFAVC